jgi:hypothetical protein
MTEIKKITMLTGIAAMVLATLFGCSLLFRGAAEQSGWYIALNIGHPAGAKGITVSEHDVTGMRVEVYGPDDQLLDTVAWDAQYGTVSYLIPVSEEGSHRIEVTHISEENGELVEATESTIFNIQAMMITVINITPGLIGVIDISGGEEGQDKEDGSLTISVTEIDAEDGTIVYIGVFPAGADPANWETLMQAQGEIELFAGAGTETMEELEGANLWIGTGGRSYDVYVWVDMNRNLPDGAYFPEPGFDQQLVSFPVAVEIDGDTTLNFQGSDFVQVLPAP